MPAPEWSRGLTLLFGFLFGPAEILADSHHGPDIPCLARPRGYKFLLEFLDNLLQFSFETIVQLLFLGDLLGQ